MPDDERPLTDDELAHLRAWLATDRVEPLDEVTRRRLAHHALDQAGGATERADVGVGGATTRRSHPRWLRVVPRVAAVAVLVVAIGVAGTQLLDGPDEPLLGRLSPGELAETWRGELGTQPREVLAEGLDDLDLADPDGEPPEGLVACVRARAADRQVLATAGVRLEATAADAFALDVRDADGRRVLVVARDGCRLLDAVPVTG